MNKQINIIVAESSLLIFEGLSLTINRALAPVHIIHADSLNEIEKHLISLKQSTVIVNPSLIQNNLKLFTSLKNDYPFVKYIALVYAWFDPRVILQFDAVINISDSPDSIIAAIKKVTENDIPTDPGQNGEILSERETDVLKLLASGLSNKEIADKLNISINTVITHRKNISQKTGIKSAQGLTIYAVVKKIITFDNLP